MFTCCHAPRRRTVPFKCFGWAVPPAIELDVRHMDVHDIIRMSDLPPLEGCSVAVKVGGAWLLAPGAWRLAAGCRCMSVFCRLWVACRPPGLACFCSGVGVMWLHPCTGNVRGRWMD